MGYRIQYGQTMIKTVVPEGKSKQKRRWILPVVMLCAISIVALMFSNVDALRDFIIPGNAKVTQAAFADLTKELREGEPLGDAITAFCMEIIENANIPQ